MRSGGVVGDNGQKGEKAVGVCTERACIHLQYRPLNVHWEGNVS